jgi:dihydroorotase
VIEGLRDGTIDMVAPDHAPHSMEEKSRGFFKSLNGIVGLETAFPALYTRLVLPGLLPLERLLAAMCHARPESALISGRDLPGRRGGPRHPGPSGGAGDRPGGILLHGPLHAFEGMKLRGEAVLTMVAGEVVWQKEGFTW